jgi:hypothetical protein
MRNIINESNILDPPCTESTYITAERVGSGFDNSAIIGFLHSVQIRKRWTTLWEHSSKNNFQLHYGVPSPSDPSRFKGVGYFSFEKEGLFWNEYMDPYQIRVNGYLSTYHNRQNTMRMWKITKTDVQLISENDDINDAGWTSCCIM